MSRRSVVGLISDTHGLLRPEALDLLSGSDLIVHAGDIGNPGILTDLARLAPIVAVRGNVDTGAWARSIPETAVVEVGASARLYVLHDIAALDIDPAAAGFCAVISGHSHKPAWRRDAGVLYVNPGSAGPRRFSLPVSVGRLLLEDGRLSADLIEVRPNAR
jgi:uncharacterized protein